MHTAEIVRVWEQGDGRPPVERALLALAVWRPEATWQELASLPLGERNRWLLALHTELAGPALQCRVTCSACGAPLELAVRTSDLLAHWAQSDSTAPPPDRAAQDTGAERELSIGGYRVHYRPLTSLDLAAAAAAPDVEQARWRLIERCVLSAWSLVVRRPTAADGEQTTRLVRVAPRSLPARVVRALAEALAESDPLADPAIRVVCGECGGAFRPPIDVVGLVWSALGWLARQAIEDVHTLAAAYGWSEADILAMAPRRRQLYLDRLASA